MILDMGRDGAVRPNDFGNATLIVLSSSTNPAQFRDLASAHKLIRPAWSELEVDEARNAVPDSKGNRR